MAKGGIGRALGYIAAGMGQGYAGGAMQDVMNRRNEVLEELRARRAAAADQQDREFRMQESDKTREFQREQFGEEKEWQREKFGLEQAADESRFQRQLSLKGAGGGGGSSAAITRTITDADGKVWGITKTGEKIDLEIQGKAAGGEGGSGEAITKTITDKNGKVWGLTKTGKKIDLEIEGAVSGSSGGLTAQQKVAAVQAEREAMADYMNPESKKFRGMSEEELNAIAVQRAAAKFSSVGADFGEVEQPQAVVPPPTSIQGDQPTLATPPGQGKEDSPFVITTEEQKAWFRDNAPSGSWAVYNGQLGKKK